MKHTHDEGGLTKVFFLYSILRMHFPRYPHFKSLELEDRQYLTDILGTYKPATSELTFTNLFIWRSHYGFQWSVYKDWLLLYCAEATGGPYAFQPVGPSPRTGAIDMFFNWLRDEMKITRPSIERADGRLVDELGSVDRFLVEPLRDHADYVYRRENLQNLAGGKYRSKRNHINQFLRHYSYVYETLSDTHIEDCLELQEKWCKMNRCKDDLDLLGEHEAIIEILKYYKTLDVNGAVILVDGKVGAFTLGEMLNDDTAVIHIEKADPDIAGLYSLINQQFCEKQWQNTTYINREQDLGIPGLREAKISYNPDHLVEKYRIRLKD